MVSKEHTKNNMNAPVKSHLKRKTTPAKISDGIKEAKVKLNTMKKADLVKYCEDLLVKNENLMEENRKLIDSKETLEDNIKESKQNNYFCGECEFTADCVHDFNDHTHSSEDLDDIEKSYFTCRFCDESFGTIPEVMRHSKLLHSSNVQHCDSFLENRCLYGDNCWFVHSETLKNSEPNYKCNFCEKKFLTKNAFRKHVKKIHIQSVSKCKNEDECKFGPQKCWFIHMEDIKIAFHDAKGESQI